jgi:RNA polymerase sigma-70 factor (ECF subfamily)
VCAEDVTQDVFHRAWTHAYGFSPDAGSPENWIIGLARRRAVDAFQARRNNGYQRAVWGDNLPVMEGHESTDRVEHAARRCEVRGVLATLSHEQRQAIEHTLRQFGITVSRRARALRCKEGFLGWRL